MTRSLLLSIIFMLCGILFAILGFSGIAIAIPITSKIFFILAVIAIIIAVALFIRRNQVKIKVKEE